MFIHMQFGLNKDSGVYTMTDELFNSLGIIVRQQYLSNACSNEHSDVFLRCYGIILF